MGVLLVSVGSIDFGDYIASYPDFPKSGILFRDISPLLASAKGMVQAVDQFAAQLSGFDIDLIAGIESRGFLFSTLLSSRLNIGSMMVRKPGKLPGKLVRAGYELEYGTAELTIKQDAPIQGQSVLVIDDLLATGGTMVAAKTLLESCGAIVPVCAVVIELAALGGRAALDMPLIALKVYAD
jgi:adenine phosphoribosyltransferase